MSTPPSFTVPEQLALQVSLAGETTFANFCCVTVSQTRAQEALLGLLQRCVGDTQQLLLWGDKASGLSHLLQAVCHAAHAQNISAQYLPLALLQSCDPAAVCDGLESQQIVCVDDLQCIAGNMAWEKALFHLYNNLKDVGHHLVMTAHSPAISLALALPDLHSRILAAVPLGLNALSDQEKCRIFQFRAQACGLDMPLDVAQYILHRVPRSLASLVNILDKLDQASLKAQRRLTIPFVKPILEQL